ncbi:hypothetical protein RhiirC2_785197 [Rhizophagus irregularis]|uniref:Uncharacterized protein n=1 Tax=Rhizophagus irregularis TaxID=588596 RepID=A0A2N1MX08_9GLOM|nr:hypothetical protein RhiirC2_785197 [Rhizophagus irregularis]
MENIELTCHLHTRPGKNVIRVNTGNDFIAGELNGFWGDLGRPFEDYTHIIIDSPHLVLKQELTGVLAQEHDEQVPDEDNQVDDGEDN